MRRFVLGSSLFMAVALLLMACGGGAAPQATPVVSPPQGVTPGAQPTAAAGAPKRGGVVTIGSIQEPNTLNPLLTNLTVSQEAYTLFLDALMKIDTNGQILPFLAKEVPTTANGDISADGKTYTFHLRDNVKWSDGQPFTSADVAFTYQATIDPKVNVVTRPPGMTGIASVETPDATTVIFHLKDAQAPWLLTWVGTAILPKHVLDGQDINTAKWNTAPTVGTGPFLFSEWVSGSYILGKKNPNYYLGEPYLDQVIYRIIPDSNALLAAQQKGDVDMRYAMTADQVAIVSALPDWTVTHTPSYSVFHFTINTADPIMSDVRVRQALTYALDKKGITQTILKGLVEPSWSPLTPASWAFDANVTKFDYNPDKAKQLLDDAGWKLNPASGVREKDGKPLAFAITNISGDAERLQIVQIAQQQWKAVGAQVDINLVDAATFVKTMQSGNFPIAYGFWGAGPDPDSMLSTWFYGKGNNWQRLNLPQLDSLIDQARVTLDQNKRKDLYIQAQELIAQQAPNIFIYSRVFFDGVKKKVHNFKPVGGGGVNTWNVNEWWIDQ